MSRTIFPSIQVGETLKLSFDFASRMTVGETISGASSSAALFSGTDASPSAILSGSTSTSGTVVTQKVAPTIAGNVYDVQCTATLSGGQTVLIGGYVAVNPRPV